MVPAAPAIVNVDCRTGSGIGDWLMFTPAFREYRRHNPGARLVVHTHGPAADVYAYNPDVLKVETCYLPSAEDLPGSAVVDLRSTLGREGTIRLAFRGFGLTDESDRRLRYTVLPIERDAAVHHLRQQGITGDTWIVALQCHGSWATKRWRYLPLFAQAVEKAGGRVVLLGSQAEPQPTPFPPGVIDFRRRTSVRLAVAIIGVCDCYVGFDSGLTLAAIAVGTPVVGLVGSHDPRGLLGDVTARNVALIRKRSPAQCFDRLGTSCRVEGRYGQICPLRGGLTDHRGVVLPVVAGADCIDDVWPDEVMKEALAMPRRSAALEERYIYA